MWKLCLHWTDEQESIIAQLPEGIDVGDFENKDLLEMLADMSASDLYLDEGEVQRFIGCANEYHPDAHQGIVIAKRRNCQVDVLLSDEDMIASMVVTGAYAGKPLRGSEMIYALSVAKVTKGINKKALQKVLIESQKLGPGARFTQVVAAGKPPVAGRDAKFTPLIDDITQRVLKPETANDKTEKVDMRDLGKTISVDIDDELMKRDPATKGVPGYTVLGKVIEAKPGKNLPLKPGKGSKLSPQDSNVLVATQSGTPLIKERGVEVDHALCVNSVSVASGHVKFKGNLIVGGDIEPGMVVRATGSITVGGFIESADVQAQGDITVGKGIIGHTVSEGEPLTCHVKTKGKIKANYAQYSELQAGDSIELALHCLNNQIRCHSNLTVVDAAKRHGTIGGGHAKVGGAITCVQLGVEGDTATLIEPFASYAVLKEKRIDLKDKYSSAQEATMTVIRKEMEFKKKPKAERTDEEKASIDALKAENADLLNQTKATLDQIEEALTNGLIANKVEVLDKVFTRVTVQYGKDQVTTKNEHGPSVFTYNEYDIKRSSPNEEVPA